MQSVCVLNHPINENLCEYDPTRLDNGSDTYADNMEPLVYADNDLGHKAMALLYNKDQRRRLEAKPCGTLKTLIQLPSPDLENVPSWLANCFQALTNERRFRPTQGDCHALSSIPYFNIEVGFKFDIELALPDEEDEWGEYDSIEEKMVLLEGLCWK